MYRGEIDAEDYYAFVNNHVEFNHWLKSPQLVSKYKVDVGIDQSSTRTGICVQAPDLLYIAELPRGYMSLHTYKKALIIQINKILQGLELNHFIFEKHGLHITPLHSIINEITDELKKYTKNNLDNDVKVRGVLPGVWRMGFLPKSEYSGEYKREKVKEASAREAIKRVDMLREFKQFSGKDLDGFEAYGIINGYLKINYAEDGIRIVNSSMEFKNGRRYRYNIKKTNISEYKKDLVNISRGYISPMLYAGKDLLLNNSLNRVVGEYERATILYRDHKEVCRFIFELEEPHIAGDMYLVHVERL